MCTSNAFKCIYSVFCAISTYFYQLKVYFEFESSHSVLTVGIINMVPTDERSICEQDAGHAPSILYNAIYVLHIS